MIHIEQDTDYGVSFALFSIFVSLNKKYYKGCGSGLIELLNPDPDPCIQISLQI
jgi:hypothetical protein